MRGFPLPRLSLHLSGFSLDRSGVELHIQSACSKRLSCFFYSRSLSLILSEFPPTVFHTRINRVSASNLST